MQILAVVVRYNTPIEESETLRGLCAALSMEPDLAQGYELLIWDNSPQALSNPELPIPFSYRHSEHNLGVSGAYNNAMQYALEHGHTWMMLLDQDTEVSIKFLQRMLNHSDRLLKRTELAAITPVVSVGRIVVSPKQQLFMRNRDYPAGVCEVAPGEAIAINSGCIMRVSSLQQIGGFSLAFWLDYSDLYVFHCFFQAGMHVWRAADAHLQHEMSIMDYDRLMTPWRYKNFSFAETAFHDLYKGRVENAIQTLRLFARAIKQRFKYQNSEFSKIAWQQWRYRMTVPKAQRLAEWQAKTLKRQEGSQQSPIQVGVR